MTPSRSHPRAHQQGRPTGITLPGLPRSFQPSHAQRAASSSSCVHGGREKLSPHFDSNCVRNEIPAAVALCGMRAPASKPHVPPGNASSRVAWTALTPRHAGTQLARTSARASTTLPRTYPANGRDPGVGSLAGVLPGVPRSCSHLRIGAPRAARPSGPSMTMISPEAGPHVTGPSQLVTALVLGCFGGGGN